MCENHLTLAKNAEKSPILIHLLCMCKTVISYRKAGFSWENWQISRWSKCLKNHNFIKRVISHHLFPSSSWHLLPEMAKLWLKSANACEKQGCFQGNAHQVLLLYTSLWMEGEKETWSEGLGKLCKIAMKIYQCYGYSKFLLRGFYATSCAWLASSV